MPQRPAAGLPEQTKAELLSDLGTCAFIQAAREDFNLLDRECAAAGSGIEAVVQEWVCEKFCFVASAYGFTGADAEELTAGRDW